MVQAIIMKLSGLTMWLTKLNTIRKEFMPVWLPILFLILAQIVGCGMGSSNSGGISGRVIDGNGDAVPYAKVVSIFDEDNAVYSDLRGVFRISDLISGHHNIVITHKDYNLEQVSVDVSVGKMTEIGDIRLNNGTSAKSIYDVVVDSIATASARIIWKTSKEQICEVIYGKEYGEYSQIYRESRGTTTHTAILGDLKPETLYHFRIQYKDENGNLYYSYDYSFFTSEPDAPSKPKYVEVQPLSELDSITVAWNSPVNTTSVKGYNVYRLHKLIGRRENSEWERINETVLDSKTFTYTDNTIESGNFYRYAVVAVNQYGAESEKEQSKMVFASGIINEGIVLSKADSPVEIYSDIVVAAGVNLNIEAGTELLINDRDAFSSGLDEERVEFIVYGQITIDGEEGNPVIFAPLAGSGNRNHWGGIRILTNSQLVSRISYANLFSCSGYAIEVKAPSVQLNNISVSYSVGGISLEGVRSILDLKGCSFKEISDTALYVKDCSKVTLANSVIENAKTGVANSITGSDNVSATMQTIIRNTDMYVSEVGITGSYGRIAALNTLIVCPNGTGIKCDKTLQNDGNNIDHVTISAYNGIDIVKGTLTITNNIIANVLATGSVGINNQQEGLPYYAFNDVYGFNTLYNGCQAGTPAYSINPNFIGGNPYSYEIMPTSVMAFSDQYGKEMGRYGITRY